MDLTTLLTAHKVHTVGAGHHHGRQGWINFDCPFCGIGTQRFHMGINLAGVYTNCWKCGRHRLVDTLVELGIPNKEAWDVYKGTRPQRDQYQPVRRGSLKMPKAGELKPRHIRYLRGRGFDPKDVERLWSVQGISFAVGYEWRLLIPIHYRDEIVSWTTRATGPEKLRYKSASPEQESMNHKHLLYGEDYCRHAVIIHEGPIDVWATGPGAVATCGTSWTQAQVRRMVEYPVRVVCFDGSRDAQARASQLCDLLEVYPGNTYNVRLETGDDPAEADPQELLELRQTFL